MNIPGAIGGIYMATNPGNYTCQLTNSAVHFYPMLSQSHLELRLAPLPEPRVDQQVFVKLQVIRFIQYYRLLEQLRIPGFLPMGQLFFSNPDSNVVTVSFPSNYSGGKVVVYANNSCSSFKIDSLILSTMTLGAPAGISGITHGSCGLSASFACPYVPNAASYNWVVPPGVVVTSGQGTINAVLSFPATAGTDTIKVNASNS